ncbi:hypothetical protein [Marinibactrum halimedae]|uniref:Uncharacterized protein n=1 Tax=Marinibactrum halimedae TaxID=1444977 RepID=A0AA37WK03_9GAMM|nr:hypothetical protein [Marinibactrum halimedae]MCD9460899.1 hypothetical protein [Marinibactrum halimedae]GLS24573.1 hypothetical protein GCM10007877_02870 [Marinibactrum halimedae]
MIEYKYKEELEILLHYARKMKREPVIEILNNGSVRNGDEAAILSKFYWDMIDVAVEDQGKDMPILMSEGVEDWIEYIFHSLNGYLVSNGYESQWDSEE